MSREKNDFFFILWLINPGFAIESQNSKDAMPPNGRIIASLLYAGSIDFDHAGDGLILDGPVINALEIYQNGYPVFILRCETAGARAAVFCDGIRPAVPTEVRLAWRDYYQVNLRNSAGIPARPGIIRSDP